MGLTQGWYSEACVEERVIIVSPSIEYISFLNIDTHHWFQIQKETYATNSWDKIDSLHIPAQFQGRVETTIKQWY